MLMLKFTAKWPIVCARQDKNICFCLSPSTGAVLPPVLIVSLLPSGFSHCL